jgi:hypothetical protein
MSDDNTPGATPVRRPAPPPPPGFRPVEAARPAPPPPPGFRPVQSEARQLAESDPFLARTAERVAGAVDTATDIGEGILSGGVNFVQGIAELPAIGFDAAFDTNTARAVTDFFEPARDFVQPEGTAGRVAADLTAFGAAFIPLAGWLSRGPRTAELVHA